MHGFKEVGFMPKVTLEEIVNSTSIDFLLTTMENFFEIAKEKRELIPGFRNSSLSKVKDQKKLRNAIIDYIKFKGIRPSDKTEEVLTLEKFEEYYNKKKWACFGTLLIAVASNCNEDLCAEVYEKYFAPKQSEQPSVVDVDVNESHHTEDSNLQKVIDDLNKKLSETNDKFQKDKNKLTEKYQKDLAKKAETIENLKKVKKDKEKEVEELKAEKEKLSNDKMILEKTIGTQNEEIQKLKIDNERILSELAEMRAKLDKDKPRIIIYGYPKEFYGCDVRDDVIQPDSFQDLLDIREKYKVKELYYRPLSISRMSSVVLNKTYPGIVIAAKDLLELESMGYLNRNIKGDK